MAFTINQKLSRQSFYKEIGVYVDDGVEDVPVTYEYSGLSGYDGTTVSATYKVSVNGSVASNAYRFSFDYTGDANPISVAEDKLKSFLETLQE